VTDTTADHFEATVISRRPNLPDLKQSTSGGAKTTAAWLRALADEIDPPKPATRPVR
jgi:hypothetical protein